MADLLRTRYYLLTVEHTINEDGSDPESITLSTIDQVAQDALEEYAAEICRAAVVYYNLDTEVKLTLVSNNQAHSEDTPRRIA
jgi:hypothetical protein